MKNIYKFILSFGVILFAYRAWIVNEYILGGDWGGNFKTIIPYFDGRPWAWFWQSGNGLGGSNIGFLWTNLPLSIGVNFLGNILGLDWNLISKLGFYLPFLIISVLSSVYFTKKFLPKNNFSFLAPLIFTLNTFILMMVGGGQIFLGISYSFLPLVFVLFANLIEKISFRNSILFSLCISLEAFFDIRIAFISGIIIFLYFLFKLSVKDINEFIKSLFYVFLLPLVLSIFLHAFWILPLILSRQNPVNQISSIYTSVGAVQFFSFGSLSQTISLLSPYWPENIFGKVGFMRPEFLILALIVFVPLHFLTLNKINSKVEKRNILFFSFLILVGAFMAKGVNDPGGFMYQELYKLPGFNLFRDPSKWLCMVVVGYLYLIPLSLELMYGVLSKHKLLSKAFLLSLFIYLILLISPAFLGKLTITFEKHTVPAEYTSFEKFLSSQNSFFRTLWIPTYSRYSLSIPEHSEISASDYFNIYLTDPLINKINQNKNEINDLGIKYMVVPFDSDNELFLTDRKYDDKKYQQVLRGIEGISWLKKIDNFGKIVVFENKNYKNHFWSNNPNSSISYRRISPVKYEVYVENAKKGNQLIFSESFDRGWILKVENQKIESMPYNFKLNSFTLPKSGNYSIEVYYFPQRFVYIGSMISILTFILLASFLVIKKIK